MSIFDLSVSRRAAGQLETFVVFKLTLRSRQRLPSLDQTASIGYEKVYYFRTRLRDVMCRPRAVPDAAEKKTLIFHWKYVCPWTETACGSSLSAMHGPVVREPPELCHLRTTFPEVLFRRTEVELETVTSEIQAKPRKTMQTAHFSTVLEYK